MTPIEERMGHLETNQARMLEHLKFQDRLIWGLYAFIGSAIIAFVFSPVR